MDTPCMPDLNGADNPVSIVLTAQKSILVIASQRVRANAGPDDRLSEAIQTLPVGAVWIVSSLQRKIASQFCRELLAMTRDTGESTDV